MAKRASLAAKPKPVMPPPITALRLRDVTGVHESVCNRCMAMIGGDRYPCGNRSHGVWALCGNGIGPLTGKEVALLLFMCEQHDNEAEALKL